MNIPKNRMGAGDGISVQERQPKKQRVQVPSARKFATRGVACDVHVKQKLREALEQYVTPPESPLRRRSLSIAEITPVTRSQSTDSLKASNARGAAPAGVATPNAAPGRLPLLARTESDKRMMDAGRRVCHQLVLNAWRRRRCQLAAAADSRDRLQTQLDQLQMQVDVLQKLRESEASRRVEAVNENHQLKLQLEELTSKNNHLKRFIKEMENEQESFKETMNKMHVELMNERNCNQTLRGQKCNVEQALAREKQQNVSLHNEVKRYLNRIEECETEMLTHKNTCKQYEDAIRMSEDKYAEHVEKFEQLEAKYQKLERMNEQLRDDKHEMSDLLASCRSKNDKLELKMHDLKKLLSTSRQGKKSTQEENEDLRAEIERLRNDIQVQNERQWWLKTGEFLYEKFTICAYLLFPAMPRIPTREEMRNLAVLNSSIALGSL